MIALRTNLIVALSALAAFAGLFYITQKMKLILRVDAVAGLAFSLILAGIFCTANRPLAYALIATGIVFAALDAGRRLKSL